MLQFGCTMHMHDVSFLFFPMIGQASCLFELRPFKMFAAMINGSHFPSSLLLGLCFRVLEYSDDPKVMAGTVFYFNLFLLCVLVW